MSPIVSSRAALWARCAALRTRHGASASAFVLALLLAPAAFPPPACAQAPRASTAPAVDKGASDDERQAEGPVLAPPSRASALVSAERLEQEAGNQYRQLLQQAKAQGALAPANHPQLQRIRAIAGQIIPRVGRYHERASKWDWQVNLIGSKQINAFCMPGGKIAFYTGIIDRLQLTDDEIAIVMGHEIAHALREHGRERVGKARLAQGLTVGASILSQLFGWGDIGGHLASGAAQLTMLKFGRDDEIEADIVGMDLAARSGFDPRAGIVLWQKMAAASQGQPPQWLSTHPRHDTRIEELQRNLKTVLPLYARTKGVSVDQLPPYRSNAGGAIR
jgi:predicted Zn-dependent protease